MPINNYNSLTFMFLCQRVSEQSKIKVLFSGDGSDEIFGGYKRHLDIHQRTQNYKSDEAILVAKIINT